MTFTTIKLAGARVLVQGEDAYGNSGKTIVEGTEWAELATHQRTQQAVEDFEAQVKEFFAPLNDAIDQLNTAQSQVNTDPAFYVVLEEGEEATPGKSETIVKLDRDSVILRLIEEDASTGRLLWIDESTLEIIAADATVVPGVAPVSTEVESDEVTA